MASGKKMLNEMFQIGSILEIDSKMTRKTRKWSSDRCGSSIFTKMIFEIFPVANIQKTNITNIHLPPISMWAFASYPRILQCFQFRS